MAWQTADSALFSISLSDDLRIAIVRFPMESWQTVI